MADMEKNWVLVFVIVSNFIAKKGCSHDVTSICLFIVHLGIDLGQLAALQEDEILK